MGNSMSSCAEMEREEAWDRTLKQAKKVTRTKVVESATHALQNVLYLQNTASLTKFQWNALNSIEQNIRKILGEQTDV